MLNKKSFFVCLTGFFLCSIIVLFSSSVICETTKDNWSVSLRFSTDKTSDIMPLILGEGSSGAVEDLKPPALPGRAVTGRIEDAVINAYVVSSGAAKRVAKALDTASLSTGAPGKMWTVQLEVEEPNTKVYVTADKTSFFSLYKLTLVDSETGSRFSLDDTTGAVELFTSGTNGSSKKLYLFAGSRSTAVARPDGTVSCKVAIGNRTDNKDISVFADGSSSPAAVTGADGSIDLKLGPGKHTLIFKAPYTLKSKTEIEVPASGEAQAFVVRDLRGGDANNTGKIDLVDFNIFKNAFAEAANNGVYNPAADFNGDGKINIVDYNVFKNNFFQKDDE